MTADTPEEQVKSLLTFLWDRGDALQWKDKQNAVRLHEKAGQLLERAGLHPGLADDMDATTALREQAERVLDFWYYQSQSYYRRGWWDTIEETERLLEACRNRFEQYTLSDELLVLSAELDECAADIERKRAELEAEDEDE
jgi:hypothetical protein